VGLTGMIVWMDSLRLPPQLFIGGAMLASTCVVELAEEVSGALRL
jgi:hypothetical protein